MRVAYLIGHAAQSPSTADLRLVSGAAALGSAGVTVDVFSSRAAVLPRRLADGVTLHRLERHGLRRRLDASYDVVHAFGLPAARMVGAFGGRRVFSPYGDRCFLPASPARAYRPSLRPAVVLTGAIDAVVCESDLEAMRVRREVQALAGRVSVVRPGIDADALRLAEPRAISRAVILGLGPLLRDVRAVRVVGAMANLEARMLLVLLGDGPGQRRLRGLVDELGLQDRVLFLGSTSLFERRRWMRTASVLVAMAASEDINMLALEAAALGKPLIVPDSLEHAGGYGYEHGDMVRVIEGSSSPLAIADAIRDVTALHRPAAPHAEIRTWAAHADELLTVYRGCGQPLRKVEPTAVGELPEGPPLEAWSETRGRAR
jgi:glycosyltransferase involved in cell wall biosynthesis